MSHKHSHNCAVCKHECLHHCTCCDKVYCCKCGKEWSDWVYYYPTYHYTSNPYIYGTTTTGTYTINNPESVSADCTHNHTK